jgi:DNA-binding transcriptional LysR family regulator
VSITRLEHCLGVRLLRRTTRTMTMTQDGKTFYALAKSIVGLTQRAFAEDLFETPPTAVDIDQR